MNFTKQCLGIVVLAASLSACGPKQQRAQQQELHLKTKSVNTSNVEISRQYATNIEGIQTIEIRPQTSGFIESCNIIEGQEVKKGDVLFTINSENQKQTVRAAEALVLVAKANVERAELEVAQVKPLVEKGIIGEVELATKKSNLSASIAQLEKAKADLLNSKENLSYTVIKSPVDGVVGDLPYKLGSLVSSQTPLPLTTVSDISEVYAFFTLTEKELLAFNRGSKGMSQKERIMAMPDVTLLLADGSTYEHTGKIVAINGLVNPRTGSVSYKAVFPNPDMLIRTGSSGTVKVPSALNDALLVPQSATFELQGKLFVYKLDENRKAISKEIKVNNNRFKDNYIAESGINIGDEIVAEGIIKVREGMTILN
ncbi:efflux RND transporter periplasmic adaptor subunit [Saccharicrinis aurantiacus]|uniref:efflux RND transporter periplasmic adaptor subunit n=1 Tax=Saccharicrinis aurantiacus TaxID=1849719 RepID=UPI00094FD22C|nr:efflux RND transporter periplasmic adaptor subunit [Saccharicrinis aurantiacus]